MLFWAVAGFVDPATGLFWKTVDAGMAKVSGFQVFFVVEIVRGSVYGSLPWEF